MKSQRKWLVGTIVILLLINIATIGSFWWTKKQKQPPKLHHFFKKELALSETQVAEFKALGKKHQTNGHALHKKMKKHKDVFFTEVLSKNPNQQTIDSLSQIISALQIEMDMQLVYNFNELKAVCETEGQREKLREIFIKSVKKHQPKKR
ncbi:MAG: hypothetical protein AB8G11_25555 [Saprospiraceae bacterium]